MKNLLYIFLLAILPLTAKAQSGWVYMNNILPPDFYAGFGELSAKTPDGGYLVCGSFRGWLEDDNSVIYCMKYDADGNLVWENSYAYVPFIDEAALQSINLTITPEGGALITSSTVMDFPVDPTFWILKIDADGNVVFQTDPAAGIYPDEDMIWFWDVISLAYELPDGNNASIYYDGESMSDTEFNISILNDAGTVLYDDYGIPVDNFLGLPYDSVDADIANMIPTSDGGFLIGGNFDDLIIDETRLYLLKYNDALSPEWATVFSVEDSLFMRDMIDNGDGTFLIFCETLDYYFVPDPDSSIVYVIKVDLSGNVLWRSEFISSTPFTKYIDAVLKDDNTITLLTASYDVFYAYGIYIAELSALQNDIIHIDQDGNELDRIEVIYTDTTAKFMQAFSSILPIEGDEFLLSGTTRHTDDDWGFTETNYFTTLKSSPEGILPECLINCVWPGDANNDAIADMEDLLSLGIAFGSSGAPRISADDIWYAHFAEVWIDTFADGTNYKYADCNGDGIINENDTLAVSLNYLSEHPVFTFKTTGGDPDIYLAPVADTLPLGLVEIPVMLDNDGESLELYGIEFSITYSDDEVIDSTTLNYNFDDCWLGEPGEIMTMQKTFPEEKRIDVGITRIDHENVIGDGQIGTLSFVVIDNIAGKVSGDGTEVSFTIDDITAIKNNEEPVLINGSEFTFSLISSVAEYNNHYDFVLFPNPASENLSFRNNLNDPVVAIEIFDLAGKLLAIENPPAEEMITIPLGHLPNGFYTIKISTSAKTETQPLVIQK